jgi:type I restriction enzyme S subunit
MEEWKEYKATDFCKNVTDGTHDSPKQKSKGYYLITSKHIKGNTIDFDSAYKISEEDYNKIIQRSKVDQWDVIISMIGAYCGFCYLEKSTKTDYAIKNVGLFKVGSEIKSKWLYYYLTSPAGQYKLHLLRTGSSQPYIALNSLRNITIPVPDEKTMRSIVSVLQSLDDKIEVSRRINDNLEQQAQALFKSWFVDFEPFKDQPFVESELGMIPQGWKVGTFLENINVMPGGTPSTSVESFWKDGVIPFFSPKDVKGVYCFETEKSITEDGLNNCSSHLYPKDTLFITARGTVGKITLAGCPMAMNQSNYALVAKTGIGKYYLYLLTQTLVNVLLKKANGAVFSAISTRDFNEPTIMPPLKELERFEDLAKPIFDKIYQISRESRRLAELRDTLLPHLMSGKININEIN